MYLHLKIRLINAMNVEKTEQIDKTYVEFIFTNSSFLVYDENDNNC